MFRDRTQAGAALAAALPEYRRKSNVTVIGLARGGVEVAAELARLLDQPLDVLCVRKVSMPGHPELAMGAVAPMGERFTNRRLAARLSTPTSTPPTTPRPPRPARWTSACGAVCR